jgi:hypothetical protein
MEENSLTLSALVKMHAELGGSLLDAQHRVQKLQSDMLSIEAVIRLVAPSYNMKSIAARRRYKSGRWFDRGTVIRHALDILRDHDGALTAREITERMLAARGVADATTKQVRDLQASVLRSLKSYEDKGVKTVGVGIPVRWALENDLMPSEGEGDNG